MIQKPGTAWVIKVEENDEAAHHIRITNHSHYGCPDYVLWINMNLEQTYPTHHSSGSNAACAQIVNSRTNRAMRLGGNVNDRYGLATPEC